MRGFAKFLRFMLAINSMQQREVQIIIAQTV